MEGTLARKRRPIALKSRFDKLYGTYNRREYVRPDPLELLYGYDDVRDGEIVGLVASSLAYGRVAQILKSVSSVLDAMGASPAAFLEGASPRSLERTYAGFKHRFTTGIELAGVLFGVKRAIERHGSLNACFTAALNDRDETVVPALTAFVEELRGVGGFGCNSLLPSPAGGSACKRLHLYLRWMVRRDAVDPGGWDGVMASKLIVPLDTHMYRIARSFGFTERRQADGKAALEVTAAFRELAPDDPVRYDFALTRLGIRDDADIESFVSECAGDERGTDRRSAENRADYGDLRRFQA
jgi:uncharacterized protein (TIGR02757 family)